MQATKKPSDNNLSLATTVVRRRRVPPTKDPLSITPQLLSSRSTHEGGVNVENILILGQLGHRWRSRCASVRARAHVWGAGRVALRRLPLGKPEARSGPDRSGPPGARRPTRPASAGRPRRVPRLPDQPPVRAACSAADLGAAGGDAD